jgi:hypothetical protein
MNASTSPFRRASLPISALIAALIIAGCATPPVEVAPPGAPTEPTVPRLGFFSRIKAPETVAPVLQLAGAGVQIFRCEKRDSGFVWNFRQPEADLSDQTGRVVARHGANFSFEHVDGSRLIATVIDFDEPPQAGDLRWLLLSSRAFGEGAFGGVTHVQRVNTTGGMPPPRCEASQSNQILRVKFTADFIFYRPR